MPRHCSDSSPPDLIRWSMLRCSLRAPVEALRERDFCMDARVKPGHDGEGKERKKIRRRNADRRNGRSPCRTGTAAPPYGRRTSIGVPPRFLLRRPNATAQLQSALPGMGPVSGRYPQTDPSQYSEAPRRPVVLPVGRVPEAARERVASPRHLRPARARSVTISTDKALWRVSFMSHHVAVCSRCFPGISEE